MPSSRSRPINAEMKRLLADPAEIDRILADGAQRARPSPRPIVDEVKDIVGFLRLSVRDAPCLRSSWASRSSIVGRQNPVAA